VQSLVKAAQEEVNLPACTIPEVRGHYAPPAQKLATEFLALSVSDSHTTRLGLHPAAWDAPTVRTCLIAVGRSEKYECLTEGRLFLSGYEDETCRH
jgi:hypothetical protein